jgi:histidyl-tRNA synthetase
MISTSRISSSRSLLSHIKVNTVRLFATSEDAVKVSDENKGRKSSAVVKDGNEGQKSAKKEKMDLNPPKGTRDFFPEDQRLRNWLFGKWKNIAGRYGFEEYDAPVLETEELFIRKAGEEVTQQLYNFEDKGGRRLALRPEMTPSLARMVLSRKGGLSFPLKWYVYK